MFQRVYNEVRLRIKKTKKKQAHTQTAKQYLLTEHCAPKKDDAEIVGAEKFQDWKKKKKVVCKHSNFKMKLPFYWSQCVSMALAQFKYAVVRAILLRYTASVVGRLLYVNTCCRKIKRDHRQLIETSS